MNLRPSVLLKSLVVLGIFISVISYLYWSHLVSIPANIIHRDPARSQDFEFDNPTGQNWTRRIWQTSRLPVVAIGDGDREHLKTWSELNPEYRHEVLTDEMMESYVQDTFHNSHPDIEQIYFEVKDYILRSDIIRYLILLADGGVYNDLDVGCEQPIKDWIPPQFKDSAGILLGVEVDNKYGPDGRTFKGGQDLFQLVNWTLMAKPNQPFMWFLVKRVMDNIRALAASRNQPISKTEFSVQDVLEVTGPAALTMAFFDYASDITKSNVTYHNFTKLSIPRLIGEVVILPIHAFGAGHQVKWAGWKESDGTPLVHHYFTGSWKSDHHNNPSQYPSTDEEQEDVDQDAQDTEEGKGSQKQDTNVTELNSTKQTATEPPLGDLLAKVKGDAETQMNEAATAATETETDERLTAKMAAEEKAELEAWRKAQEDTRSDGEKEEDERKEKEQQEEEEREAKEQKEEDERRQKWEEVKLAAPKTAPLKTYEEKQKSSNDLSHYDFTPD